MHDRMLIKAAINGGRSKGEHPAVPVTPEEQARAVVESLAAGAGAAHVHARGADGRESLEPADVAATLRAVRAAAPGFPVGVSTGAWIVPDPARRHAAVAAWTELPDFASVNFGEDGAEDLAATLLARGVGVEAGLSNSGDAGRFLASGLADRCLRALLEPQEQDVAEALRTASAIEAALARAGVALPRLLHGTDATAWDVLDAAIALGFDTRIGFEDTLTLPDGTAAASNAVLVAEAARRAR